MPGEDILVCQIPGLLEEQNEKINELDQHITDLFETIGVKIMPCPPTCTEAQPCEGCNQICVTEGGNFNCLPCKITSGSCAASCGTTQEPCGLAVMVNQWLAFGQKHVSGINVESCPDGTSRVEVLVAINGEEMMGLFAAIRDKIGAAGVWSELEDTNREPVRHTRAALSYRQDDSHRWAGWFDGAIRLEPQSVAPPGAPGAIYNDVTTGYMIWDDSAGVWRSL